jgi:hypothetical protein
MPAQGKLEFRFTSEESDLLRGQQQITEADKKQAEGLAKIRQQSREAAKAQRALAREADRTKKAQLGPQERYIEQVKRYNRMLRQGMLTKKQHTKAIEQASAKKRQEMREIDGTADAIRRQKAQQDRLRSSAMRYYQETRSPRERAAAKLWDLHRARQQNLISQEQYRSSARRVRDQIHQVDRAQERAKDSSQGLFGRQAVQQIGSYVAGIVSVSTAIGTVRTIIQETRQELDELAQKHSSARSARSELAQLAGSNEEYQTLIEEANQFYTSGAVESRDEGARLRFAIRSAGEDANLEFYQKLGQSRIMQVQEALQYSTTLRKAFGRDETGGASDIMSKAFAASEAAQTTVPAILTGSARPAAMAYQLGLRDEEALAAVSATADSLGGAEGAGTAINSLFASILERLPESDLKGKSLDEMIRMTGEAFERAKIDEEKPDMTLREFLGRKEAVSAYVLLNRDREIYQKVLSDIEQAQQDRIVFDRMKYPLQLLENRADQAMKQSQAKTESVLDQETVIQRMSETMEDIEYRELIQEGYSPNAAKATMVLRNLNPTRMYGQYRSYLALMLGDRSLSSPEAVRSRREELGVRAVPIERGSPERPNEIFRHTSTVGDTQAFILEDQASAMQEHTEALRENTEAMREQQRSTPSPTASPESISPGEDL